MKKLLDFKQPSEIKYLFIVFIMNYLLTNNLYKIHSHIISYSLKHTELAFKTLMIKCIHWA